MPETYELHTTPTPEFPIPINRTPVRRRTEALDQRFRRKRSPRFLEIEVVGGLPPGEEAERAYAAGHTWQAEPGENVKAFRSRTRGEAIARGATSIVYGGVPD